MPQLATIYEKGRLHHPSGSSSFPVIGIETRSPILSGQHSGGDFCTSRLGICFTGRKLANPDIFRPQRNYRKKEP